MSDFNLPSLPSLPPPPSLPTPPPFAPGPSYGYSPLPATEPPTPRKGKTGLWIGLGVIAALAVGAGAWAVASSSDDEDEPSRVASSVPLPAEGSDFNGESGWAMTVGPEWSVLDFGNEEVEGGWSTGGGDDTFLSNVNVLVETPDVDPTLAVYLEISVANIRAQVDGANIVGSEVVQVGDQRYGRIEYSATMSGVDGHFVGYVVKLDRQFVVATFTTLDSLFAAESPQVEPYLATLRGQ